MDLSERVKRWRRSGESFYFRGRRVHVHARTGEGPTIVLLHGFPTSSFDWVPLLEHLGDRSVLAFDFLGFGCSEKPAGHEYTLRWQADLTEALVEHYTDGPVFVAAHDMGTSVATELMAREVAGEPTIEVTGALLFNGSMVLERAEPTLGQKLLRSRGAPLFARLMDKRVFLHQFGSLFSAEHPLSEEDGDDLWALVALDGGHRIGHRLINYMDERLIYAERWHGAIRDWPRPLSLLWGMRDSVAVPAVLEALRELRPTAPVEELSEIGHYPQLEVPERVAAAITAAQVRAT